MSETTWFTLRNVVRLINIGCACTIIAFGIIELIPELAEFWGWIFFCYQMIFAVLILAAEMKLDFILKYFRFLEGNIGKGWFLMFCGMWMIQGDSWIAGNTILILRLLSCFLWICHYIYFELYSNIFKINQSAGKEQ